MPDKIFAETGIIGGTGFYSLKMDEEVPINYDTPFGYCKASCGRIGKNAVLFVPRHGLKHELLPHEVNHRANIHMMKKLGVKKVFAFCMVGSLKKEISPGDFVIPDQYIDFTHGRSNTFFGKGSSVYVSMTDPFCSGLSSFSARELSGMGFSVHNGGTYICLNGPHFSTRAESRFFSTLGDIIGMTAATEAKLAREAGLCYCVIAAVVDNDTCGMGMKNMKIVVQKAKQAAVRLAGSETYSSLCKCPADLSGSIVSKTADPESSQIKSMLDRMN